MGLTTFKRGIVFPAISVVVLLALIGVGIYYGHKQWQKMMLIDQAGACRIITSELTAVAGKVKNIDFEVCSRTLPDLSQTIEVWEVRNMANRLISHVPVLRIELNFLDGAVPYKLSYGTCGHEVRFDHELNRSNDQITREIVCLASREINGFVSSTKRREQMMHSH